MVYSKSQVPRVSLSQFFYPKFADIAFVYAEGSCALHAYSEVLTVMLRKLVGSHQICVDLAELLQMCVNNGVLTATGTTGERLKKFVNSNSAIPLQGSLPDHFVGGQRDMVENHLANISVMGCQLLQIKGVPLPFGTPTSKQAEDAIEYREMLCDILDKYAVIICFPLQEHYRDRRDGGVPYRLREGDHHFMKRNNRSWWNIGQYLGLYNDNEERVYHCVAAYAYDCRGGDVRSMRIHYQENARGFPDDQPGRHSIDPDAIVHCFVPFVDQAYFCNTPNQAL